MTRTTTDIYPTRYAAFDKPGTWAVFTPTNGQVRFAREDAAYLDAAVLGATSTYPGELAVLSLPAQNERYPNLVDGGYAEVQGLRGKGPVRYDAQYTAPTPGREQRRLTGTAPDLDAAIATCEQFLLQAVA